ncbi:MAG: DUF2336 domain-containing protein [Methylocystaceae bacterium]|nr:DUF2336 domain-containing protein [Methylocystaceae bacterium]
MSEITQNDVKALYDDTSPQRRASLAHKIGRSLRKGDLSDTESELAVAICQQLSQDVETSVRQALAESIKDNTEIPKELAVQLANDVLEVSLPVLEFSRLLNDQELITIARSGDTQRQIAITHRAEISPVLSHTLAEVGDENVVESLLQNPGAEIEDETYESVLDRFKHSPRIHTGMAKRHTLPKHIIERMVDLVGDQLKAYLVTHHQVSHVLAEKMILESRTDAVRRLLADPMSTRDAETLVKELARKEKLTPELIFRALEIGDRAFFEHAMAQRVGIAIDAARTLIKDPGERGFAALYQKAALPKKDFQAINYLVDVEYRSKRNAPITKTPDHDEAKNKDTAENWLTETEKTKKKWGLF